MRKRRATRRQDVREARFFRVARNGGQKPSSSRAGAARSKPALELAPHHRLDHAHSCLAVVQAGYIGEALAAGLHESRAIFDGKLFQRLEAIGGEARRDDGDASSRRVPAARASYRSYRASPIRPARSGTGRSIRIFLAARTKPRATAGRSRGRDRDKDRPSRSNRAECHERMR